MLKNIHHHMFSDQIFGKKINDIAEIFITLVTKFKKTNKYSTCHWCLIFFVKK